MKCFLVSLACILSASSTFPVDQRTEQAPEIKKSQLQTQERKIQHDSRCCCCCGIEDIEADAGPKEYVKPAGVRFPAIQVPALMAEELNQIYKTVAWKDRTPEMLELERKVLEYELYFRCVVCYQAVGPFIDHPYRHPAMNNPTPAQQEKINQRIKRQSARQKNQSDVLGPDASSGS